MSFSLRRGLSHARDDVKAQSPQLQKPNHHYNCHHSGEGRWRRSSLRWPEGKKCGPKLLPQSAYNLLMTYDLRGDKVHWVSWGLGLSLVISVFLVM